MPDLSQPLDETGLKQLQKIVATGKANEYLNLGDELITTYGGYTMPFEVVGFDDAELQDGSKVPAINLLSKYTTAGTSQWGSNANRAYSESILRNTIQMTQASFEPNFVDCLANTKVQTISRTGSTDVVYDKMYAPSMAQMGVTEVAYNSAAQAAVEGPAFTWYSNSVQAKRVKSTVADAGTNVIYWTRSIVGRTRGCATGHRRAAGEFASVSSSRFPAFHGNRWCSTCQDRR